MKRLILIDANSIIHRCFHALPPLSAKSGEPAQAIYGLASVLIRILRDEKPDYAAACFDRPEPTFRKERYLEYKAQRPKAPSELISQLIEAPNLFQAFGIKTLSARGFEADDVIATLAERFGDEEDLIVEILTGDLDTLQLVSDGRIVVRAFRKGISDTVFYDEDGVRARYGLEPKQLVDYKSLVGDPSDNIKGISGVGPKTACALLQKYGTLQKALEHPDPESRVLARLAENKEALRENEMLVTLRKDAPVEAELPDLKFEPDRMELEGYFHRFGFQSLLTRLAGNGAQASPKKKEKKPPEAQGSMF